MPEKKPEDVVKDALLEIVGDEGAEVGARLSAIEKLEAYGVKPPEPPEPKE